MTRNQYSIAYNLLIAQIEGNLEVISDISVGYNNFNGRKFYNMYYNQICYFTKMSLYVKSK